MRHLRRVGPPRNRVSLLAGGWRKVDYKSTYFLPPVSRGGPPFVIGLDFR